jgi:hypothetical protein
MVILKPIVGGRLVRTCVCDVCGVETGVGCHLCPRCSIRKHSLTRPREISRRPLWGGPRKPEVPHAQ